MTSQESVTETFVCADTAQEQVEYLEPEPPNLALTALRRRLESTANLGGLIGVSVEMEAVHDLIRKAKDRTFPVLILGETGTGKELVARCIHNSGPRKHSPFVAVDCSCLAPTLIESELFGHVRGAFTGADTVKNGLEEAENEWTLFIDEIGDLP